MLSHGTSIAHDFRVHELVNMAAEVDRLLDQFKLGRAKEGKQFEACDRRSEEKDKTLHVRSLQTMVKTQKVRSRQ